jgi:type II secretory pathway component PulK
MSMRRGLHNNRGVALLIVLLVTALLIALIFEFAYGARVSLRAAVNFRDSQRAYFLARLGVKAFEKYGVELRKAIPQGQWQPLPSMGEADTIVSIKWEDETGKIRINDVRTDPVTKLLVSNLFTVKSIDQSVYDRLTDPATSGGVYNLGLLSGLHEYMSDEEYSKVSDFLTVSPNLNHKINVNAASSEVLQSFGLSQGAAELIIKGRQENAYTNVNLIPGIGGSMISGSNYLMSSYLTVNTGNFFKVECDAMVGGYTQHVEAIVQGNSISYWRAL